MSPLKMKNGRQIACVRAKCRVHVGEEVKVLNQECGLGGEGLAGGFLLAFLGLLPLRLKFVPLSLQCH